MARHAYQPHHHRGLRAWPWALVLLVVFALFTATGARFGIGPQALTAAMAKTPVIGSRCPDANLPTTTVTVTVAPELLQTVTSALAPLRDRTLRGRACVKTIVASQEPSETVDSAQVLPVDRAPDVWLPDSSLWRSRVPRWPMTQIGSFARSPVVIASSQATLNRLGWQRRAPSWAEAIAGKTPVAVPTLPASAPGLSAVIALWQSLGKGDRAQQALAGAVLAAGRAGVPTEQEALATAENGSPTAPLLPTSEQAVTAANAASGTSQLVSVEPTGGAPYLDYPIYTLRRSAAVDAVTDQLRTSRAQDLARAAGFQVGPGLVATTSPLKDTAPQEVSGLVQRITALSAPSRVLVVFDLSGSMAADAGNGMTRIKFAAVAAKAAGDLMTDHAQTGLWGFSRDLRGDRDVVDLVPVAALGSRDGSVSHRERMYKAAFATAGQLGGNGTSLYKVAVAGMKRMNELYDPRAANAVVLFTDGANSDPGGPSLSQTVRDLKQLYDPERPVRLICVGIGDGVDMKELNRLTSAVHGLAYPAESPAALPRVLFEAMNRRGS